jgi:uncharacterized lipoprotein NlpE involved in copper resistance
MMKKLVILMLAMVLGLLVGCGWRSETTCSGIESRWGKPAKIIKNDNGTVTYHWFFQESSHGAAPFSSYTYWAGYEFVCDQNGKIISKRNFTPQPTNF